MSEPTETVAALRQFAAKEAQLNIPLPDGFRLEHHPRSRVGQWWCVHPGGWLKCVDRQDAEMWLHVLAREHRQRLTPAPAVPVEENP